MRILIVKLSSLGDLFHALPAVHNLKIKLQADIHWVVQNEYHDLVKCFSDVDKVIPFDRKNFPKSLKQFVTELRSTEYDMVIDMQGLMKSALITMLARGKRKIGPSFHREGTLLLYPEVAGKRNKKRHAVEENFDVIKHLGLEQIAPEFPINLPKKEFAEKKPRVALLPSSRWPSKNWPPDCFTELAQHLMETCNASIFLLGGPEDAGLCGNIAESLGGHAVNMAGRNTLIETASLLKEMDLLISNDSGPVHIAAALNTPVLAIFGPTDPQRTGPYGSQHHIIAASMDCRPCFSKSCRSGSTRCMSAISPSTVEQIAIEMLSAGH